METKQINKAIVQLSESYDSLNKHWQTDPCAIDDLQLIKQKEYFDFFECYKDFNFEEIVTNVINLRIDCTILNGIRSQLKNNFKVYKKNKNRFDKFNTYKLFEFSEQQLFDNKLEVLYRDKADVEKFDYKFLREQEKLLTEIEDTIRKIESEKSGYIYSGQWLIRNYYKEIHTLTLKFLSILESYFPETQKENTKIEQSTTNPFIPIVSQKEKIYVNMRLSSDIHELCNDQQFEPLSEEDFYQLLNNLPCKIVLAIKTGEKSRVYFLIHKILETLSDTDKKEWKSYIFQKLKIREAQYKSKYREPISQMPSKKSKKFAKMLEEIFNTH